MSTCFSEQTSQIIAKTSQPVSPQVLELNQELATRSKLSLRSATTLPQQMYTSEEYFQYEVHNTLSSGWMCIAHVSQLKEPGSYLAVDLLSEPMVVVRQDDLSIRVLSRVC